MSDLFGRVLLCISPFIMDYAIASNNRNDMFTNDGLRLLASSYSYLILIFISLIFLIIGSIVGYFYPTPQYGLKPYPKPLKILISVGGGILAFVYYIETKKDITPTIIIWVACISFVFPAIIHLIHAFIVKYATNKMNLSDEDLKRIQESFKNQQNKDE